MRETIKRLYKPFILIFLVSLLIINWNDISWLFNYRVISAQFSKLWEKNKPEQAEATEGTRDFDYFDKENSIEIPKIGVEAPIIFAKSNNQEDLQKVLKDGVLFYPQSVLPGERGTIIILGHSAPVNWPKINYDDVFNHLNELESGDEIIIYYEHLRYIYKVYDRHIFYPEEEQEFLPKNNKEGFSLVLLTCWPPGKDYKRLTVLAELAQK